MRWRERRRNQMDKTLGRVAFEVWMDGPVRDEYWDEKPGYVRKHWESIAAAVALEAVERMEAERDHWKSIGAEEELRRLARTHKYWPLESNDLTNFADEIKAQRESAEATPGTEEARGEE
jgi:hypothetical protein